MNEISAFFVRNIVAVFFFYGLAFFIMGLALVLAGRRASQFRFARAILPLALFGFLHAGHEWVEMFQKIAALTSGYTPGLAEELVRVTILVLSFVGLLVFGLLLLTPAPTRRVQLVTPVVGMVLLWLAGTLLMAWRYTLEPTEAIAVSDDLARYGLGIPASLLGTWALMAQQRTFREHDMPEFGRDLVWAAAALFLYGALGQVFVRETVLAPTHLLNSANFLQWFGIPVQLFRAVMAAAMTVFLVRALRAFEMESHLRLQQANEAKLAVQATALESERRTSHQMERLNEELRLAAHKLSLLLDLSNLVNAPLSLSERLYQVLDRIVQSLPFSDAGLILLAYPAAGGAYVAATTGYHNGAMAVRTGDGRSGGSMVPSDAGQPAPDDAPAAELGAACIERGVALCRHRDGTIVEFHLDALQEQQACRLIFSPTVMIGLPLITRQHVIGGLVLARRSAVDYQLASAELALMVGIAQQLGLSVENALLHEEAQQREQVLAELLRQVVGAQEAERQRIARELHDATGQSLTAVALGLRGVEARLSQQMEREELPTLADQVKELKSFSQNALGELRTIISDLRPPQLDDLGLVAALHWYIQAYERRRSIATSFSAEGDEARLSPDYKTVLFRIAQEALTNIAKHAAAKRADVALSIGATQVELAIYDDGRGFDPRLVTQLESQPAAGWGLVGIRERALLLGGQCAIETAPGRGTRILVTVPLAANGEHG